MDQAQLIDVIQKTAALMEQFERRSRELEHQQQALSQQLQQLTQLLPGTVRQSADASLQRLPTAVMQQIETALGQAMSGYEQRLRDSGQLLQTGAEVVAAQVRRTEKLSRTVAWKALGSVIAAVAILLAGSLFLASHYRKQIRDNQIRADLLRAYNQADVTLCGERLCANVDVTAKGSGPQQQYRPVQPRR